MQGTDHRKHTMVNSTWIGLAALLALGPKIKQRIELSRAKHRSLAGHSRLAKRLARLMPGYSLDEARFFSCDGAPAEVMASAVVRQAYLGGAAA